MMKKWLFLFITGILPVLLPARTTYFSAAGSTIALVDHMAAAAISLHPDDYTRALTPFDLSIRLDKATGLQETDYLQLAAADVQDWPAGEETQLRSAFAGIDTVLKAQHLNLHLPDTILLIKTTGKTEFGSEGWTRANRIMLNTGAQTITLHLVAHELFHVISRYNERTRNAAYAVFHFKPCNNIVYKPVLKGQVITNPDCPFIKHYITLKTDSASQDAALILYSKKAYHKGYTMYDYMTIGLLALTGDDGHKKPLLKDGKPVIYELTGMPDFFKQIGTNTPYVLHVEEISAEHFAALITGGKMQQPEYIAAMAAVLRN